MVNTGYRQQLHWGNETAYGSSAIIGQPIGLVQSVNPTETNNFIKVRTLGGSRDYNNNIPGKFEVSGSFDYYLQHGAFLRQAIGEDTGTTTTVDSGPKYHSGAVVSSSYVHIMGSAASPLADSFPSFTLELADSEDTGLVAGTVNLKRKYTGCRVNNLAISANVDNPVSVTCDWIAQGVTMSSAAATAVTEKTTDPYIFYQGAVYATSGAVSKYTTQASLYSSRICEVNGFNFSVNNNLEPVWYICGTSNAYQTKRGLKKLVVKGRDYDGSLNLHFANKAQFQRFLGSATATTAQDTITKFQVVLDLVRSGTIGSTPKAATDDWIRIVMNNAAFDTENIPAAPEDIVAQTIGLDIPSCKVYVVDSDLDYKK